VSQQRPHAREGTGFKHAQQHTQRLRSAQTGHTVWHAAAVASVCT
jgi:hypothetical protein